jgi:hypothetical protein
MPSTPTFSRQANPSPQGNPGGGAPPTGGMSASPWPGFTIPPGVATHILSSSDTSECGGRRRPGSTGVQRKSMSGHNLIADATRASGDVMASQMLDMAEASCELERSKIEVQLKLFMEQMAY